MCYKYNIGRFFYSIYNYTIEQNQENDDNEQEHIQTNNDDYDFYGEDLSK